MEASDTTAITKRVGIILDRVFFVTVLLVVAMSDSDSRESPTEIRPRLNPPSGTIRVKNNYGNIHFARFTYSQLLVAMDGVSPQPRKEMAKLVDMGVSTIYSDLESSLSVISKHSSIAGRRQGFLQLGCCRTPRRIPVGNCRRYK
jgi:hypothetical protein